jgi:hypothetical protein
MSHSKACCRFYFKSLGSFSKTSQKAFFLLGFLFTFGANEVINKTQF